MALFDRETDSAKERDGVPLDFGDHRVTLRRMGGANSDYEVELERALKPHRAAIRHGKLAKDVEEGIVFRVFAKTCVVRWETKASTMRKLEAGEADSWLDGIDMRGKLVPSTEDNVVAVYTALPGLFLDHRAAARGEDLFRLEQREDDAGN